MQTMGMKPLIISDYMRKNGLDLPPGNLFEKAKPPVTDEKFFPSRQRKGEGEPNEKIGTGERGTTREDQLVSRGTQFNRYPYTYEVN